MPSVFDEHLTGEALDALAEIQEATGLSAPEVVSEAVRHYKLLLSAVVDGGGTIHVDSPIGRAYVDCKVLRVPPGRPVETG